MRTPKYKQKFEKARRIKAYVLLVCGVMFSAQAIAPQTGGGVTSGPETWAGVKTFSNTPVFSTGATFSNGATIASTNGLYDELSTTSGFFVRAAISAGNATATNPAFFIRPSNALDPTDGVLLTQTNAGSAVWSVNYAGTIVAPYTDSTGTPGAATIDKPFGKSAIAIGASSVVITNAQVAATDIVMITPISNDTTCTPHSLRVGTTGAGSFTVNCAANATAATQFSWAVFKTR